MANIKIRRGYRNSMPVLRLGELGFCIDTKELYIGTAQGNFKLSNIHFVGDDTPSQANEGDLWFNPFTNVLKVYFRGFWIDVMVPDESITTEKLADFAITNTKVANEAITTDKLADGAVTDTKIFGRLSFKKLPTSSIANRVLIVTTANSDPQYGLINEDFLSLSDVTTWDVTTTRHGFCPKLSGNSQHFLRGDGIWATPPSGGLNYSNWFVLNPINTNTWYIPYATNCTALTTLALTASRIYYIPFIPLVNCIITNLAIEVTTASAGTASIGIYDTLNHRPNNLLGSVTGLNTGTTGVKSGSVSVTLTAGQLYWLALISSASASVRAVAVGGISPILGIATGATAFNTHYFQAGSGSTLPNPAGANSNGTGTVPVIYVRFTHA